MQTCHYHVISLSKRGAERNAWEAAQVNGLGSGDEGGGGEKVEGMGGGGKEGAENLSFSAGRYRLRSKEGTMNSIFVWVHLSDAELFPPICSQDWDWKNCIARDCSFSGRCWPSFFLFFSSPPFFFLSVSGLVWLTCLTPRCLPTRRYWRRPRSQEVGGGGGGGGGDYT